MKIFKLTKDHIKLIRCFCVGWQDCEFGAPEIDPKRPFGNSSVLEDIHEILTDETIGCTNSKRDKLTDEEVDKYNQLYKETETALQIILVNGIFRIGSYKCEDYGNNWKLIK